MSTVYSQNWSKGATANAMRVGFYRASWSGGSDAADSLYPEIASSEAVDVIPGAGPSGENVLDYHVDPSWSGSFPHDEDYQTAGIVLKAFGPLSSPHSAGWWNAPAGVASWKQNFTSRGWNNYPNNNGAAYDILLFLGTGLYTSQLGISVEVNFNGSPAPTSIDVYLRYRLASGSVASLTYSVARGATVGGRAIENAWQDFTVTWQCGTVTNPSGPTVASDGSVSLTWNGVVVLSATNIPLLVSDGTDFTLNDTASGFNSSIVNWLRAVWFGYFGLFGPMTAFVLTDSATPPTPPDPGPDPPPSPTPGDPTKCTPQAQLNNGGKGKSGCNPGGKGWTPSYDGPYGVPPAYPDPPDGEPLTGRAAVDLWIEVQHDDGNTVTQYNKSIAELADDATYHGGRKELGLLEIGDVDHGLSNEQGSFVPASADLKFNDAVDRFWRQLLATEDLEGDEVDIFLASPIARASHAVPHVVGRMVVQKEATRTPLEATLTATDAIFSEFGPFGPNRQFPSHLIPPGIFANMPPDTLAQAIPVLYGEKSDHGAKDPLTGKSLEKGLIPLIYAGQETLSVGPNLSGVPSSETGPSPTSAQGILGGDGTWVSNGVDVHQDPYHAVARVTGGVMTWIDIPGRASTPSPAGTVYGFRQVWNDPNTTPPDYYLCWQIPADYAGALTWDPVTHPAPSTVNIRYQKVGPAVTQPFSDWKFGVVYWRTPDDGAVWPPTASNTGTVWDAYIVAGHACFRVMSLYGSDLGKGNPTGPRDRVQIDLTKRAGVDILVPTWTGWPFPEVYRDKLAPDGRTYRFTVIYVRGPLSDDHKAGTITMAVNAIGVEEIGDGSGLPLIDAHAVEQHWIDNWLLLDYTSGLWAQNGTEAVYADGTPCVRSSSFLAAQAFQKRKVGGRGLTVGWYVGAQAQLTDYILQWNDSTETRLGQNEQGQFMLGWIDDTVDTTVWPVIEHVVDVFGSIERSTGNERANVVVGVCDWDPDAEKFRVDPLTLKSAAGIAKYKGRERAGGVLSSTILNQEDQWANVLLRRLGRLQYGSTVVTVPGGLGFLDHEVGTGILLTSVEGPGPVGYVHQPMLILRRNLSISQKLVTYTLLDVGPGTGPSLISPPGLLTNGTNGFVFSNNQALGGVFRA